MRREAKDSSQLVTSREWTILCGLSACRYAPIRTSTLFSKQLLVENCLDFTRHKCVSIVREIKVVVDLVKDPSNRDL